MKESKAVYVTKRDIKVELNRELQFYPNKIIRDREISPHSIRYDQKTQEVGCQYNCKRENLICTCKNLATIKKRQEVRYFGLPKQIYAYHGSKSFTDIGVGSVKALQRKTVKRIYLPETDDRGVGSSDLSSYFIRRTRQLRGSSYYENKSTSSKCVGGILEYNTGCVMNKKLSPIVQTVSGSTSPRESTLNKNIEIGSNTVVKSLKNTTTQVEEAAKKEIDCKPEETIEVKSAEPPKPEMKTKTVETNKTKRTDKEMEKDYSSDSLVQHVHNLENSSDDKQSHLSEDIEDQMENKLEREYRKIFASKPKCKETKPANDSPITEFKSTSTLKRRFEALRRGLARKEDSKRNAVVVSKVSSPISAPSRKDVSINSSPPSLEGRSYSNTKPYSPFQQNYGPEKTLYTPVPSQYRRSITDKKEKDSAQWSSRLYDEDSECQGVKGMFKLWGKKFNLDEDYKGRFASKLSSASSRKSPEKKIEEPKLVIKPEVEDKKEGRKFFFFKKKKGDSKEKPYKPKKDVTAGRCEVRDGLMIKIAGGGNAFMPEHIPKQPIRMPEEYNDMVKNPWLTQFLSRAIESRKSVQVRWNNKTYAPSSSTVFELMDNVYKDTGIVFKSKSQVTIHPSYKPYTKQHVNFVHQNIEAWMIPKTLTDLPKLLPVKAKCKSDEERKDNIEVRISDQKWFIDKSKAFSHKIEVVLHSKNFGKLNKEKSSEYLRIDIPKGFFVDSSSEDNNNKHTTTRSSDEEVYKIVEYETESELKKDKGVRTFEVGDHKPNNIKVTVSVKESEDCNSKILETMIKGPSTTTNRDVEGNQGSDVIEPKRCDVIGVGIITQRDLRVIRKPILKIQDDFSEDESEHNILKPNQKKCEFAESYLQEYYRHWTPLGIDLYSWCISDSHLRCCSEASSTSFNNQGIATKSCPNIYDDFQASTIVSSCGASSCSHCHHDDFDPSSGKYTWFGKLKKKIKEPYPKDINTGALPKDSIEVFKRRKLYAASLKSKWAYPCSSFDKPTSSVPSVEIRIPTGQDTLTECPKLMKSCCKTIELKPKKRTCKKHVSLPDCDTMNDMLARQSAMPEGILAFKGLGPACEICKRKGTCPKHAKINPNTSCEIPRAPCRSSCEVMKKSPCASSKTSCEKPPSCLTSPPCTPPTPSCAPSPRPSKCKKPPVCPPTPPSCPPSPPPCTPAPPRCTPAPPRCPPAPPPRCPPPPPQCPPSPSQCPSSSPSCPPSPPSCPATPSSCPATPQPCPRTPPLCPSTPPSCPASPPSSPPSPTRMAAFLKKKRCPLGSKKASKTVASCSSTPPPPCQKKPPPCPPSPPPCLPSPRPCMKPRPPSPSPCKKPCPSSPPPSKKPYPYPPVPQPCRKQPTCPPAPQPCPPSPPSCPPSPPPRSPSPPGPRAPPHFPPSKPPPYAKKKPPQPCPYPPPSKKPCPNLSLPKKPPPCPPSPPVPVCKKPPPCPPSTPALKKPPPCTHSPSSCPHIPPCPPSPPPCPLTPPCPTSPPPCPHSPPCPPSRPPCPPSPPPCPPSPPPCPHTPPCPPSPPPCPHNPPCPPSRPPCLPSRPPYPPSRPPCPPSHPPCPQSRPPCPPSRPPCQPSHPLCPPSPPPCPHTLPCPPSPPPCPHTLPCPESPPPCSHTPPCPKSLPPCPHTPTCQLPVPPCPFYHPPCPHAVPKRCPALCPRCVKPSICKKIFGKKTPICLNSPTKEAPCKACQALACQPEPCEIHTCTKPPYKPSPCQKYSLTSCSFGSTHPTPDAPYFYSPIHPCPPEKPKPCAFTPCSKRRSKIEPAPNNENPLSSEEFPWPTKNQTSNQSSVTSVCEVKTGKPHERCQEGCPMLPQLSCDTIPSPKKECKSSCPNRQKTRSPCLPIMQCPAPPPPPQPPAEPTRSPSSMDTARNRNKSKTSGVHLKKEPGPVKKKPTCSKDCLAWESGHTEDRISLNSKERITIRLKNDTPSTQDIREGVNMKVQDEDGMTLFERKDYRLQHAGCSNHRPSLLGDMYKASEVRRVATNNSVQSIGADKDGRKENVQDRSHASLANLIEIQFKLKVTQGEKTTEINIANDGDKDNEVDAKFEKKEPMNKTPQEVFVVKDGGGRPVDSPDQKNDINIRIVIKNFKSKSGKKKSVNLKRDDYSKDFSKKISAKFHTVSTGYSDVLNCDNVFSVHRATVDLTSSVDKSMTHSNKSEEIISEPATVHERDFYVGSSDQSVCRCITTDISEHKIGDNEVKSVPSGKYSDNKEIQEKKEETETDTEKVTDHKYEYTEETDTDKQIDNKYDTEETDTEKQVEPKYDTEETDTDKRAERKYDTFISTDTDEPEAITQQDTFKEKLKTVDVVVKPHSKDEKKEMLKHVFEKVHETKAKNKTRMRKLRDMLKVILTSDSSDHDDSSKLQKTDLTKDVTYVSLKPNYFRDSDSMNNYYRTESQQALSEGEINKQVLYPTGENVSEISNSNPSDLLSSENEAPTSTCMCSTVAARLKLASRIGEGGGCCCGAKPNIKINEEISCDLKKGSDSEFDYIPTEFVDVETQNSRYLTNKITSTNLSLHRSMKSSIFECINKQQEINVASGIINVDKTLFAPFRKSFCPPLDHVRECEMRKLNKNTILSISDQDKIVLLSSKPTRVSTENPKTKEKKKIFTDTVTISHSSDILQSYETKKAVLEIYTEKTFSEDGERLVAKLPKFVYGRENEIQTNYEAMANNTYKAVCKRSIVMMAIHR